MGLVVSRVTSSAPQASDPSSTGMLSCVTVGPGCRGLPQSSAVCLPVLGGVSPTFAPLPWQCCAIAHGLVLGLLCGCGGRGRASVLLVRLGRVCTPEPQEWGSPQGPLSSITLLAPSMPSWESSHLTSTSRHPLSVIMLLEPRFCTNRGLYHHPHCINTVARSPHGFHVYRH